MNVLDAGNQPLSYISLQQEESTDSQLILIRVPCVSGLFLTAEDVPEARMMVSVHGAGSFQDVAISPLDLAPYDGTTQDFDLKVHTTAVSGVVPVAVDVRVTYNP